MVRLSRRLFALYAQLKRERGFVDMIGSSGLTLEALISDILDMSKIEAGKLAELHKKHIDIGGLPGLRSVQAMEKNKAVLAAVEALRGRLPVTAQAVRNGLVLVELPGRFQIVPGQPTLVLDVAHNPHSVAALTANLDAMGFFPTTHAVFGAMADKDLGPMLAKVGPLVDRWYFTNLPTPRAETAAVLQQKWNAVQMVAGGRRDVTSSLHADPMEALEAAVAAADPADRIVVFGSFYTVGGVLINGTPRLHAKHLGQ